MVFPDAKPRLVFEAATEPDSEPKNMQQVAGETLDITLQSKRDEDKLFVIDPQTGNVLSKLLAEIREGTWPINPNEAKGVKMLKVAVTYNGNPVSSANVELKDQLRTQSALVSPANKGVATFFFVRFGEIKVKVKYNSKGKSAAPVEQTFKLDLDRSEVEPTFAVAVPAATDTVSATSTDTNAPSNPVAGTGTGTKPATGSAQDSSTSPTASTGGNFLTNLIVTLLGLGVAGGVIYVATRYMKSNPDKVKDVLTKLGADVPNPPEPAQDPVVLAPVAPEPMAQIILDPSGPDPVQGASSAGLGGTINLGSAIPTPASTGIPTLVATDGSRFEIPEGDTTVGRELGVGLVVPNETISRNHAMLVRTGTQAWVKDTGSTNGTWLNQVKVTGSSALRSGDSVRFGSVEFRYES